MDGNIYVEMDSTAQIQVKLNICSATALIILKRSVLFFMPWSQIWRIMTLDTETKLDHILLVP